jgi:hypothetical protein
MGDHKSTRTMLTCSGVLGLWRCTWPSCRTWSSGTIGLWDALQGSSTAVISKAVALFAGPATEGRPRLHACQSTNWLSGSDTGLNYSLGQARGTTIRKRICDGPSHFQILQERVNEACRRYGCWESRNADLAPVAAVINCVERFRHRPREVALLIGGSR